MHLFQRIHPLQLYTLAHLVACTVTTAVKVVAGDLVRKYDVHVRFTPRSPWEHCCGGGVGQCLGSATAPLQLLGPTSCAYRDVASLGALNVHGLGAAVSVLLCVVLDLPRGASQKSTRK